MSKAAKDPDIEPWPYPPYYQPAIRNPMALTVVGAVLTLGGFVFVGIMTGVVVASAGTISAALIPFSLLMPAGFGVVLYIGIVRLRWQRAYFRRHGVMPELIGQRKKRE